MRSDRGNGRFDCQTLLDGRNASDGALGPSELFPTEPDRHEYASVPSPARAWNVLRSHRGARA